MQRKVVNWIYTSVIRPIVTYGCAIWWEALKKEMCFDYRCIEKQTTSGKILLVVAYEVFIDRMSVRRLRRLLESGLVRSSKIGHTKILQEVGFFGLLPLTRL